MMNLGPTPTLSAIAVAMAEAKPHLGRVTVPNVIAACHARDIPVSNSRLATNDPSAFASIYFELYARRNPEVAKRANGFESDLSIA
jgi:hypothetical protein